MKDRRKDGIQREMLGNLYDIYLEFIEIKPASKELEGNDLLSIAFLISLQDKASGTRKSQEEFCKSLMRSEAKIVDEQGIRYVEIQKTAVTA